MAEQLQPEDSYFRKWFRDCLQQLTGRPTEWPILLRQVLQDELQRLRLSDQYYKGEVFINRDDRVQQHRCRERQDEEILVYKLYAAVHETHGGVLTIGGTPIWLFSCEVPNQGKELSYRTTKRRADLVGLCQDGSLIVLECKGPDNSRDSPLVALLEGLDYLGCLLTERNLACLNDGMQDWLLEYEHRTNGFCSTYPKDWSLEIAPDACHRVVVLAPQSYFDLHRNDANGQSEEWWKLSDRSPSAIRSDRPRFLDFAVVDYQQGTAAWLDLSGPAPAPSRDEIKVGSAAISAPLLTKELVWTDGDSEVRVTRVRRGEKNTRIRLPDGTTCVVPNSQLRPVT